MHVYQTDREGTFKILEVEEDVRAWLSQEIYVERRGAETEIG